MIDLRWVWYKIALILQTIFSTTRVTAKLTTIQNNYYNHYCRLYVIIGTPINDELLFMRHLWRSVRLTWYFIKENSFVMPSAKSWPFRFGLSLLLVQGVDVFLAIISGQFHDDVIKWKHFPRYWPFVRGIHRSPVNSPHKGQWHGALMYFWSTPWINGWVNNREAGDLRRHRAHYDVNVMSQITCMTLASSWAIFLTDYWYCEAKRKLFIMHNWNSDIWYLISAHRGDHFVMC